MYIYIYIYICLSKREKHNQSDLQPTMHPIHEGRIWYSRAFDDPSQLFLRGEIPPKGRSNNCRPGNCNNVNSYYST